MVTVELSDDKTTEPDDEYHRIAFATVNPLPMTGTDSVFLGYQRSRKYRLRKKSDCPCQAQLDTFCLPGYTLSVADVHTRHRQGHFPQLLAIVQSPYQRHNPYIPCYPQRPAPLLSKPHNPWPGTSVLARISGCSRHRKLLLRFCDRWVSDRLLECNLGDIQTTPNTPCDALCNHHHRGHPSPQAALSETGKDRLSPSVPPVPCPVTLTGLFVSEVGEGLYAGHAIHSSFQIMSRVSKRLFDGMPLASDTVDPEPDGSDEACQRTDRQHATDKPDILKFGGKKSVGK